jgi:DNA polymerase V
MQSQKQSSNSILSFPSFTGEFECLQLDLNEELIKHPEATSYARVRGHSMKDACIQDGEFTLKRLAVEKDGIYLMSANDEFKPIKITDENDFLVWGVVAYVVHKVR